MAVVAAIVVGAILLTRNTGDSTAGPTTTTSSAAASPSVPAEPSNSGSAMPSGSSADLRQWIGTEFNGALDPAPGVTAVHASAVGSDSIEIGDLITSNQQARDISVWLMGTPDGYQFWLTRFVGYEDTVPFYRVTDVAAASSDWQDYWLVLGVVPCTSSEGPVGPVVGEFVLAGPGIYKNLTLGYGIDDTGDALYPLTGYVECERQDGRAGEAGTPTRRP